MAGDAAQHAASKAARSGAGAAAAPTLRALNPLFSWPHVSLFGQLQELQLVHARLLNSWGGFMGGLSGWRVQGRRRLTSGRPWQRCTHSLPRFRVGLRHAGVHGDGRWSCTMRLAPAVLYVMPSLTMHLRARSWLLGPAHPLTCLQGWFLGWIKSSRQDGSGDHGSLEPNLSFPVSPRHACKKRCSGSQLKRWEVPARTPCPAACPALLYLQSILSSS
jgi:hypothetical protein